MKNILITGVASGGEYFIFFAKPHNHKRIKNRLKKLQHIDFDFSKNGSFCLSI